MLVMDFINYTCHNDIKATAGKLIATIRNTLSDKTNINSNIIAVLEDELPKHCEKRSNRKFWKWQTSSAGCTYVL